MNKYTEFVRILYYDSKYDCSRVWDGKEYVEEPAVCQLCNEYKFKDGDKYIIARIDKHDMCICEECYNKLLKEIN